MLWLPDYEIADPPPPGPADVQRMAVDAVRDGLPLALVARLFALDSAALRAAVDEAPARSRYRHTARRLASHSHTDV